MINWCIRSVNTLSKIMSDNGSTSIVLHAFLFITKWYKKQTQFYKKKNKKLLLLFQFLIMIIGGVKYEKSDWIKR